jgi:hypothetical protein
MKALRDGMKVAVTIDTTDGMPYKVLYIRGTVHTDTVEGPSEEYKASSRRVMGEEGGEAWIAQVTPLAPRMSRIVVKPEWVGILDFETRFPNALERAMESLQPTR